MTQPDPTMTKLNAALSARMAGANVNDYLAEHRETIAVKRQEWRGKIEDFWNITAATFREAGIVNKYGVSLSGAALRKAYDRSRKVSIKADAGTKMASRSISEVRSDEEPPPSFVGIGKPKTPS